MNIFADYQVKIFKSLTKLQKANLIVIPKFVKRIVVELPPANQTADISCNAAMVLAKDNSISPKILAEKIKSHLLKNFREF